jgi:anti-sigma factor RsiW
VTGHLREHVAALVDGQLDYRTREKALAHLAGCAQCRAAVEHQRWVKQRVQTLPSAEPSAALLSSLTTVTERAAHPGSFAPPPARGWGLGGLRGVVRRGGLFAAGAGSLAAGVVGVAYALGGPAGPQPDPVTPPVGQFSAEFAGSEQRVPFSDPALDVLPVIQQRAAVGGR